MGYRYNCAGSNLSSTVVAEAVPPEQNQIIEKVSSTESHEHGLRDQHCETGMMKLTASPTYYGTKPQMSLSPLRGLRSTAALKPAQRQGKCSETDIKTNRIYTT
jgi:hypothetical protein